MGYLSNKGREILSSRVERVKNHLTICVMLYPGIVSASKRAAGVTI